MNKQGILKVLVWIVCAGASVYFWWWAVNGILDVI